MKGGEEFRLLDADVVAETEVDADECRASGSGEDCVEVEGREVGDNGMTGP